LDILDRILDKVFDKVLDMLDEALGKGIGYSLLDGSPKSTAKFWVMRTRKIWKGKLAT